jgi:hypothetical protein
MRQTQPTYVAYTGSSMNPILKSGDLLEVLAYNSRMVDCGDVIVFYCPEENCTVVHRVVATGAHGIRTRGDDNARVDPWLVSPELIAGYAIRAQRGLRWRRISGGRAGCLVASVVRGARYVSVTLLTSLHPLHLRLAITSYLAALRRRFATPRVLAFRGPGGTELQLLAGRRVIGALPPGQSRWVIRRPFRWLVNEASLLT